MENTLSKKQKFIEALSNQQDINSEKVKCIRSNVRKRQMGTEVFLFIHQYLCEWQLHHS